MNIKNEIIEYIKQNRISTTEVADALGKKGVLNNVNSMLQDTHRVGSIRAIFSANNSNYFVHEQIRDVEKDEIVVIYTHNCDGRAIIGDIVSKFILLYKGANAVVVDGLVRDAARLKRENYAVWSKGVTPLGCYNEKFEPFPIQEEKDIRENTDGAIAVCDDGGVVIISNKDINKTMLERLHDIEQQEDIWNFCLNTLKWDTKRIICDKDYLYNGEDIPEILMNKFPKNKNKGKGKGK
jgi:regulator of RNase E activity RraA